MQANRAGTSTPHHRPGVAPNACAGILIHAPMPWEHAAWASLAACMLSAIHRPASHSEGPARPAAAAGPLDPSSSSSSSMCLPCPVARRRRYELRLQTSSKAYEARKASLDIIGRSFRVKEVEV